MSVRLVPSVAAIRSLRRAIENSRPYVCHDCIFQRSNRSIYFFRSQNYHAQSSIDQPDSSVPLRKQLKDEAKARRAASREQGSSKTKHDRKESKKNTVDPRLERWELTVGIEIHVELDTAYKLFSSATTSFNDSPNTHVAPFDAALPGAQPQFQIETLIPALRAALAFDCEVQKRSAWDRKHYFWWDQPNGYQITQYYEPYARNGSLTLYEHDEIDPEDGPNVTIGIKQIQMEQDTAKTIVQPPTTHLLDLNRVSHPLIEIISYPQIHSPKTAAAFVRKVQSILKTLGVNTTGMEMGGLRADVNVSIKPRDGSSSAGLEYAGFIDLGQRTEIKNLSSFKAVEDAITFERDRQISVLEAGGVVEGETRGFALGGTETRRIRGKEGEVDYRYMPDPDLGAVYIGDDLLAHLKDTMPLLPDQTLKLLTEDSMYGITMKDAKTLLALDEGDRLDYYLETVHQLRNIDEWISQHADVLGQVSSTNMDEIKSKAGKQAANWVLHELGARLSVEELSWDPSWAQDAAAALIPPPDVLTRILAVLLLNRITLPVAKTLLFDAISHHADPSHTAMFDVFATIKEQDLLLQPMTDEEYTILAQTVVAGNADTADKVRTGGEKMQGKIMWFVGQMVRQDEQGRVQPERAKLAVRDALFG